MKNFEQLYRQYAEDVYRFAYWLSGNAADADDITSETFVRAWLKRKTIRTETVKAYLFTIARNLYLKEQARAGRESELPEREIEDHHQATPERITADRLEFDQALQLLAALSEIDRTALILKTVEQLPYAEIARILSISEGAAKVKVHRARLKLALKREEAYGGIKHD